MENLVLFEIKDRIAFICLNRPEKRNALSAAMVSALSEAFFKAQESEQVKVIILHAVGSAFCSGADLESLQSLQTNTYDQNVADSEHLSRLFYHIYTSAKPVIAAVQGPALAGGCGLATLADFTFAVPEATFGYTEARIGFIPAIVSVYLQKKLGDTRTRQLLLSAEIMKADKALAQGLVYEIVHPDELLTAATSLAQTLIKQNSAQSMAATKALLLDTANMPLQEALSTAIHANAQARASADCQKGIAAFLNKEKIVW